VPVTERGALIGLVTMDNVGEFLMIQAAAGRADNQTARPTKPE
jgi:hypothetical protein